MRFTSVGLCVTVVGGCMSCDATSWRELDVPKTLTRFVNHEARLVPPPPSAAIPFGDPFYLDPDHSGIYDFRRARTLAAIGYPHCRIAVYDQDDRAIHTFSLDGSHYWSAFGNGRSGQPDFTLVHSLAWHPDTGELLAAFLPDRFAVIDGASGLMGRVVDLRHRPYRVLGSARRRIHVVPGGPIVDHWFGAVSGRYPSDSIFPREAAPLLVGRDENGNAVNWYGQVTRPGGASLATALSRGHVSSGMGDTIWFAREHAARILGFPVDESSKSPTRVVDLPVFLELEEPREFQHAETRLTSNNLIPQILGFRALRDGTFVVLQAAPLPGVRGAPSESHLIVRYSADGRVLRVLRAPRGSLMAFDVADNRLFAIVAEADARRLLSADLDDGVNRCDRG